MATNTVPDPLAGARSSGWILIGAGAISIVAGLLARLAGEFSHPARAMVSAWAG